MRAFMVLILAATLPAPGCQRESPPASNPASTSRQQPAIPKADAPKPEALKPEALKPEAPNPKAVNDLFDKGIILVNKGRRKEWTDAPIFLKAAGLVRYLMYHCPDLTSEQQGLLARKLRATVDSVYEQTKDDSRVIEILAMTMALDGQQWLKELRTSGRPARP